MEVWQKVLDTGRNYFVQPNNTKRLLTIGLSVSFVGATILYIKFGKRRNYFDEIETYRASNEDECGDPTEFANLKRCKSVHDTLKVIYSKKGIGSSPAITIPDLWDLAVSNGGDKPFMGKERKNENSDEWKYEFWTWNQTNHIVNTIAYSLISLGINKFDVCNIIGSCSPKFQLIFFGTMMCGSIPGGCYTTNLSGSLKYICNLCKTKIVFVEDEVQLNKYKEIMTEINTVKYIVIYGDEYKDYNTKNNNDEHDMKTNEDIKIMNWNEFMSAGMQPTMDVQNELRKRKLSAKPEECAIVLYTSGTTGFSKGVMLSHDNITYTFRAADATWLNSGGPYAKETRILSYLPLSHVVGQSLSWWIALLHQGQNDRDFVVYYCRKDVRKTLALSMKACQPTSFVAVPRIYEKFHEKLEAGMATAGFVKKLFLKFVLWVGTEYYRNTLAGGSGEIPRLWPFVSNKLCDGVIKKSMGFGDCNQFISGGAPLPNAVREKFGALNMVITDAYGLSETCGVAASSRFNNFVPDAVGPIMDGMELLIDHNNDRDRGNNGEICLRGRTCMMGYINEYEKTKKVFDNQGWFHTGDVGYLDKYNCLHITGRIKELLVTRGGENIAPVPVENYIKQLCPALSQCIMVGDKQKYCSLLVSIAVETDEDTGNPTNKLQDHAKLVSSSVDTVEAAMEDEKWLRYIGDAVNTYNANGDVCVSNACRIQYFQILLWDLNVNNGTLSASLKVKRFEVYKVYKNEIEKMYHATNPTISVKDYL